MFHSLVYLVCRYSETRPQFRQLPAHEGFDLSLKGQQVKYRDSFEFTLFARLLFSANRLSANSDASQASFDRWLIVPFGNRLRHTRREIPR
jgi:hypothetical protein